MGGMCCVCQYGVCVRCVYVQLVALDFGYSGRDETSMVSCVCVQCYFLVCMYLFYVCISVYVPMSMCISLI
jgi:hypothetical protein